MEALSSTSVTRLSPNPNTSNAIQIPRVSSFSISNPKQNLGKPHLVAKLVMQEMGNETRRFECRSSFQEAEFSAESKMAQHFENAVRRKRLAVFVSGGGSNFRSIHEATLGGSIPGDVVVLVTDKPGCGGAEYASNHGIPVIFFPKTESSPEGLSAVDLVTSLRNFNVDFILLAGYLKLIPGARYSGPTVHFVDENFDTGSILAQRVVPVLANDTAEQLATRVLHEEHKVYVEVISALCEERIVWREDGVPLIRSRENPDEYS
ncbi:phosphoribosylglycinamide formyltransferase, chloroplastic-like isoform X2 [Asparagus officinalis]|uniref:phosphoribosylglycinamide formyltransferase, chloroplastic-like isoform X2 n=1 Tax=Asparagus officinalis TaxID=4686 RepID=UPI00098DFEC1|nr:phosphoribosylglycinamide formyltransferase, chloroplastic-like isoform X2 [Asparagus officinalis]